MTGMKLRFIVRRMDEKEKKEMVLELQKIHAFRRTWRRESYKKRKSKLDRYRDEIETMRYELHEALIDIRIYLWIKHRLSVREWAISARLRHWREQ